MKKILLVIPALNAGGAERVMATLANEWCNQYEIDILMFQSTDSLYTLNHKIKLLKMGLTLPNNRFLRLFLVPIIEIKRYRFLRKTIKKEKYCFVMSFTNVANYLVCLLPKRISDSLYIISERADPKKYSFIIRMLIDVLYRRSDLLICQNEASRDYYAKLKFKNKLTVLPNPVNFDDIPDAKPSKKERAISTVGRLTPQKNHRLLIEAFDEIFEDYPEYKLKIYGAGPLESELKKYSQSLRSRENIEFLGVKKKVMFDVSKTEIFVLSSDYEGFPNVLIEAMASYMPVVSSDFSTGVARELIDNGRNGYIFQVGDKAELIEALRSILNDRKRYVEIGISNRKIAAKYRSDIVANMWLEEIKGLRCTKRKGGIDES